MSFMKSGIACVWLLWYKLLLTLSSIGIPSVISKLVSERIAIGDTKGADRIFRVAFKLFTTIGFVLSIGLFFSADFIAEHRKNIDYLSNKLNLIEIKDGFVRAKNFYMTNTIISRLFEFE